MDRSRIVLLKVLIVVIVLGLLIGGGWYLISLKKQQSREAVQQTNQSIPKPALDPLFATGENFFYSSKDTLYAFNTATMATTSIFVGGCPTLQLITKAYLLLALRANPCKTPDISNDYIFYRLSDRSVIGMPQSLFTPVDSAWIPGSLSPNGKYVELIGQSEDLYSQPFAILSLETRQIILYSSSSEAHTAYSFDDWSPDGSRIFWTKFGGLVSSTLTAEKPSDYRALTIDSITSNATSERMLFPFSDSPACDFPIGWLDNDHIICGKYGLETGVAPDYILDINTLTTSTAQQNYVDKQYYPGDSNLAPELSPSGNWAIDFHYGLTGSGSDDYICELTAKSKDGAYGIDLGDAHPCDSIGWYQW